MVRSLTEAAVLNLRTAKQSYVLEIGPILSGFGINKTMASNGGGPPSVGSLTESPAWNMRAAKQSYVWKSAVSWADVGQYGYGIEREWDEFSWETTEEDDDEVERDWGQRKVNAKDRITR